MSEVDDSRSAGNYLMANETYGVEGSFVEEKNGGSTGVADAAGNYIAP